MGRLLGLSFHPCPVPARVSATAPARARKRELGNVRQPFFPAQGQEPGERFRCRRPISPRTVDLVNALSRRALADELSTWPNFTRTHARKAHRHTSGLPT